MAEPCSCVGNTIFWRGALIETRDLCFGTPWLTMFPSTPTIRGDGRAISHEVEVELKSRKSSPSWRSWTLHGMKDMGWDDWDLRLGTWIIVVRSFQGSWENEPCISIRVLQQEQDTAVCMQSFWCYSTRVQIRVLRGNIQITSALRGRGLKLDEVNLTGLVI